LFAGDRSLLPSALCLFHRRIAVPEGDPCQCDEIASRPLGGAYRCGRPRRMGKRLHISSGIMTGNSGRVVRAWPQQGASRYFERHTGRHKPMPDDERFLLSVRRECLDHFLILHEKQLSRLLRVSILYFNQARPHQGLGQRIPDPPACSAPPPNHPNEVTAVPVWSGLHHDSQRAA